MLDLCDGKRLKLWNSATYRIEVEGEAGGSIFSGMSGMRITTHTRKDQSVKTTLVCRMRDQAELTGLLNALHDLHLPILSVTLFEDENKPAKV